jgi:ActR/RegA family two-component response regulator
MTEAARRLGIHRTMLHRKIAKIAKEKLQEDKKIK